MARIRTIKPSFWTDDKVRSLSRDARLLLVGLISQADDAGRFIAVPITLSGNLFTTDNIAPAKVKKWRDEIAGTGIIQLYSDGGADYGHFPHWLRHQRIDKRQPSTLPAPPDSTNHSKNDSENHSTNDSENDSSSNLRAVR